MCVSDARIFLQISSLLSQPRLRIGIFGRAIFLAGPHYERINVKLEENIPIFTHHYRITFSFEGYPLVACDWKMF